MHLQNRTLLQSHLKSSKFRLQVGVTIVELLIYMGLFMGFLAVLSGLFVATLDVQEETIDTARIEQDSQYVYAKMQYDLGRAIAVVTPATNGDTTSSLVLTVAEGSLTYFLEDSALKITSTATGETHELSSDGTAVTQLNFQRLGNEDGYPSIRMTTTLQSITTNDSTPETRELVYTLGLR